MSDFRIHLLNLGFADILRLSILAELLIEVGIELVNRGSTALLARATLRTIVFTCIHPHRASADDCRRDTLQAKLDDAREVRLGIWRSTAPLPQ